MVRVFYFCDPSTRIGMTDSTSEIGYLECPDGKCTWIKWTLKKKGILAAARTFESNTMVGFFKGTQTSLENPSTLSDIQFLRSLEVWDQFCEADDQLFDEVLELLKRTNSQDYLDSIDVPKAQL